MTTNQTIDGVLVLRAAVTLVRSNEAPVKDAAIRELRALLDAPAADANAWRLDPSKRCPQCVGHGTYLDGVPCGSCAGASKPASQPHGEPVAWLNIATGHVTTSAVVVMDWDDEKEQVQSLYAEQPAPFQSRVQPWMMACFGEAIAADRQERNHRFLEEALELVQANQCTASEAHQLVDYVYSRTVGEPSQEVGGVMVTLAALCLASGLDMHTAGETELARIWNKVEQIRAKQATKPAMSPLPGAYPDREQPAPVAVAHPFADKVIRKLERFQECADDGQGADIGRHWFDLLTQLGLLNRVQRSPALWEMTQQGEDALDLSRQNAKSR
ncbi:hypothetical protein [Pseudomonas sp. BRG-100]|uniref:hypothetical protein n=1 Tax=Pseudomonas sp. BRG-100 TaxID=1524267 RepID=UPI000A4D2299|nr:hypothetical protein [Pseudomonas sp. BRG-100]